MTGIAQLAVPNLPITPAPVDKAVIYFARTTSTGSLINFMYFNGDKLIGKCNGRNYVRYEVEPGEHLLWARSENRDFVKAQVEAGRVYFIEVIPVPGMVKAGVALYPVNPQSGLKQDLKALKRIAKLMGIKDEITFSEDWLANEQRFVGDVVDRGINVTERNADRIDRASTLEPNMYYSPPE